MKTAYSYNKDNGAFVGTTKAQKNPRREGEYLLPANSTFIPPPSYGVDEIPIFDGDSWSITEDHRGKEAYFKVDPAGTVPIDFIGPIPGNMTLKSPEAHQVPVWDSEIDDWVNDDEQSQAIADLEARIALLEEAQESDGVYKYTPDQIKNYIDNQIDNAATAAEKLEVIKMILKRLAIYILK
jgi:hypothetical protein